MDEAVADEFTAPGDVVERAMYGYSTLICLPDGLLELTLGGHRDRDAPSRAQPRTPAEAGFAGVEVLPIDGFAFFRFYRLRH